MGKAERFGGLETSRATHKGKGRYLPAADMQSSFPGGGKRGEIK